MKEIGCTLIGTLMPEFREGLRTYGVYLRRIHLSFRSFRWQIDQGHPLLLGTEGVCGHLSLIIGYETPDRLAIRNHGFFRRWFSFEEIREQAEGALCFPGIGVYAVYCYDGSA